MSKIIKQVHVKTLPVIINSVRVAAGEANKPVGEEQPPSLKPQDHILIAQQEAAACIAKAMAEMEEQSASMYKSSQENGFSAGYADGSKQGYAEGYASGEQAAKKQMEAAVQGAAEESARILAVTNRQVQQTILSAERQIIEISLAVAEKILACEIDANSQAVVAVVKTAMDKVRNQEQITVRVNPSDYATVIAAKGELDTILQREQSIEFAADQTVSRSGCVIDSGFGSVDARVETQLQALQATLRSLLT